MPEKEVVTVPELADPTTAGGVDRAYVQCIAVGDWIRVAGQVAVDEDYRTVSPAFEPQVRRVYANIRAALEAAGSSLDGLVHQTVWLTDIRRVMAFNSVAGDVLDRDAVAFPATSVVGAHGLVQPEWHVEIEATAVRSDTDRMPGSVSDRTSPAGGEVRCVSADGLAFASGHAGVGAPRGDPGDDARRAFENVGVALEAAGTSLDAAIHGTIWVSDPRHAPAAYAAGAEALDGSPTISVLGATGLGRSGPTVGVELQAALDSSPLPEPVHVPGLPDPAAAAGGEALPTPYVGCHVFGDWIYCSAQAGVGVDGDPVSPAFEPQVRAAFDNVVTCLEAAGAGLEDLVHMRVYLDDMGRAWEFLQLRRERLGERLTTSSLIGQRPPRPGLLVAIEARALRR